MDRSTFIFKRRVMSEANALAAPEKVMVRVCSLTHLTAGLEHMDRYERGPAFGVSLGFRLRDEAYWIAKLTVVFPICLGTGQRSRLAFAERLLMNELTMSFGRTLLLSPSSSSKPRDRASVLPEAASTSSVRPEVGLGDNRATDRVFEPDGSGCACSRPETEVEERIRLFCPDPDEVTQSTPRSRQFGQD